MRFDARLQMALMPKGGLMSDNTHLWTSESRVWYPLITETALAPDGAHVVYTLREPLVTETESRYLTHLYLTAVPDDARSGEPIQLTCGPHSNHHARWSPDGAYLAFLSDRTTAGGEGAGKTNIYVMRMAGGEPWALTAFKEVGVTDLAWSPDGQRIAFLVPQPPSADKLKARKARDDALVWDEDHEFQHVFTVPFSVAPRTLPEAIQLTRGRFHVVQLGWLRDGARLAIVHQPTPLEDEWTGSRLALVLSDLDAGRGPFDVDDLEELGTVGESGSMPMPSPDGAWIACVTGEQPVHWGGANRVVLYAIEGGESRPLVTTPDGLCWLLGWAADGASVYVAETSGLDTHIWSLDLSGESATPVLATPTCKTAMHSPGGGMIAFSEETFLRPNSLWVWGAADSDVEGARFVTAPSMPDAWPDAPLPEVEVLQWEPPDPLPGGNSIEGILIYPFGYEDGEAVPLVVDVHGGPAGVFQRRYLGIPDTYCDVLAMAEKGMAVLRVNPRGSGGYGREFRFANYGDWGGGDFRDIMAGVDLLIDRGIANPERLGIMGWSYGGFMTSWAITQTDRFRAACVGAGVTNLMSFTGTSDIPSFLPDYFSAEFWEDLDAYRQHSALFQIHAASTPTLIQHGEADIRVPLAQGRELYNALKRRGIPVKMVIYPRQGHGIGEPRLVIDRLSRPVAWFVQWLVDEEAGDDA
jgi:dipeptidyl aminopeptidase/acylaminoacyl peptidase